MRQLSHQPLVPSDPIFRGPQFIVIQRYLLRQPQQVCFGFDTLRPARLLWHVEVATSTGHSMRALIEEVVRAVAMAEIVELPRLVR